MTTPAQGFSFMDIVPFQAVLVRNNHRVASSLFLVEKATRIVLSPMEFSLKQPQSALGARLDGVVLRPTPLLEMQLILPRSTAIHRGSYREIAS